MDVVSTTLYPVKEGWKLYQEATKRMWDTFFTVVRSSVIAIMAFTFLAGALSISGYLKYEMLGGLLVV